MSQSYTPSWPDLSGWTQDPHNGSITPGANQVVIAVPNGQDADWSATVKLAPSLRLPLTSLGLTSIQTLLVIDVTLSSYGGTLHNYNEIGVGFFESDTNFIAAVVSTGTPLAKGVRAVANSFSASGVSVSKTGAPLRFVVAWNNGTESADVDDPAVTLAAGEVAAYISDDDGATWTTVWAAAAMPVSPTDLALYLHNFTLQKYDVTATFKALAVTAPTLPNPDVTVTDDYPGRPFGLSINDAGELTLDDNGQLMRDYSVRTRCRVRLLCHRGKYWADPEMGSRFYTLKTLKAAEAKVQAYAAEALQPLIDDGSILGVTTREIDIDEDTGQLVARIVVSVGQDEAVDLGLLELGRLI